MVKRLRAPSRRPLSQVIRRRRQRPGPHQREEAGLGEVEVERGASCVTPGHHEPLSLVGRRSSHRSVRISKVPGAMLGSKTHGIEHHQRRYLILNRIHRIIPPPAAGSPRITQSFRACGYSQR